MNTWVRPASLGVLDGATTQLAMLAFSLGAVPDHTLILGLAGWVAGAMSMSVNEYVSVADQNRAEGTTYSPLVAALASLVAFSVGAALPLLPLTAGLSTGWALATGLVCLFGAGSVLARFTQRHWAWAGLRQALVGALGCLPVLVLGYVIGVPVG